MRAFRRTLLELWAILMLSGAVAFMGPFGTYLLMRSFTGRFTAWWFLIMGAYTIIRPMVFVSRRVARMTGLPEGVLVYWVILLFSFPIALIWRLTAPVAMARIGGYSGLVPFALLCSLSVAAVVWWAERADANISDYYRNDDDIDADIAPAEPVGGQAVARRPAVPGQSATRPRLHDRLSRGFSGEILALEGEDHYVRVHGRTQSELVLIRLRDAISLMDHCAGEQTHRSWWVARGAVADTIENGRKREIRLVNGLHAPIARDTFDRLRESGFLPG